MCGRRGIAPFHPTDCEASASPAAASGKDDRIIIGRGITQLGLTIARGTDQFMAEARRVPILRCAAPRVVVVVRGGIRRSGTNSCTIIVMFRFYCPATYWLPRRPSPLLLPARLLAGPQRKIRGRINCRYYGQYATRGLYKFLWLSHLLAI